MSILAREYFHNEKAAFAKLEAIVWPNGPVCPHCGNDKKKIYELKGVKDKKGRERIGLKKCGACRKQFTVRVGTVFESSPVPLFKWLQACYLTCSSKKGISSHQLHRILEVTYKTAWFMTHRIRKAMERDYIVKAIGGDGGTVEMNETYIGEVEESRPGQRGHAHKLKVVSLVERTGEARSFKVDAVNAGEIKKIAAENIARETTCAFRPRP